MESDVQKVQVHVYTIEYFSLLHPNPATYNTHIFFYIVLTFNNVNICFNYFYFIVGIGHYILGFITSTEDKSISDSRLHDLIELECKGLTMNQINLNQSN